MGWFRRVLQWLIGGIEPERARGARPPTLGPPARAPRQTRTSPESPPVIKKSKTLGLDAGAFSADFARGDQGGGAGPESASPIHGSAAATGFRRRMIRAPSSSTGRW